jgi:hypothetical protein
VLGLPPEAADSSSRGRLKHSDRPELAALGGGLGGNDRLKRLIRNRLDEAIPHERSRCAELMDIQSGIDPLLGVRIDRTILDQRLSTRWGNEHPADDAPGPELINLADVTSYRGLMATGASHIVVRRPKSFVNFFPF